MKVHHGRIVVLLSVAVIFVSSIVAATAAASSAASDEMALLTSSKEEEEEELGFTPIIPVNKPNHFFVHIFKGLSKLHGRIFVSHETQHGRLLVLNGNPKWLPTGKRNGFDAEDIALSLGLHGYLQPEDVDQEKGEQGCQNVPISGLQEKCGFCPDKPFKNVRYWCEDTSLSCCNENNNQCKKNCPGGGTASVVASDNLRGSDNGIDPAYATEGTTTTAGEGGGGGGGDITPASIPVCGNGIVEEGEECDEGDENGVSSESDCLADCTSSFYVFNLRVNIQNPDVEFYLVRGSAESIMNLDNLEATGELRDDLRKEFNEGNVYGSGHPANTNENYSVYTLNKYLTPDDCYRFIFWDPTSLDNDGVEMQLNVDGVNVYSMETYNVLKVEPHDSGGVKFGNCGSI